MIQSSVFSSAKEPFIKLEFSQSYGITDDFYAETRPFKKVLEKYYYIEKEGKLNWFAALHKCRELGGDLVNFENDNELNAVLNELNKSKCYWIDLTDLVVDRKFHSITTGHPLSFQRWGRREPNNLGGNEHCVQLVAYHRKTFSMNDNKCHNQCFFICETKLPLQTNIVVW
ncbi:hypothetical protein ACLKA7_015706 [Drosophila subpalustris]